MTTDPYADQALSRADDRLFLSIVIPTYNRQRLVKRSIDSALSWIDGRPGIEIVVADDASTDNTIDNLSSLYKKYLDRGVVRIAISRHNGGPCAAKNVGAKAAGGTWLMFLDSDDELIAGRRDEVMDFLRQSAEPIVFFRCLDMKSKQLIGEEIAEPVRVDAKALFTDWRWGECLPVARRDAWARFPYEASLRGHEGLAYGRMFKHLGAGVISPLAARLYDTSPPDRISALPGIRAQAIRLAKGYRIIFSEFFFELGSLGKLNILSRVTAYSFLAYMQTFGAWLSKGKK